MRLIVIVMACFLLLSFSMLSEAAELGKIEQIKVVRTAYYKPLEKQKKFARGSYRKDVEMNGLGKITKSKTTPSIGTVAVDPRIIPFGTVLIIPGYGIGVARDTGKKIKGRKIDVFTGEGEEACKIAVTLGREKITIVALL